MPAKELLEELESMRDRMSMEDANHVMSFGGWPTVKNWARELSREIAAREMDYTEEPAGAAEATA
jgi:hypothetical protein